MRVESTRTQRDFPNATIYNITDGALTLMDEERKVVAVFAAGSWNSFTQSPESKMVYRDLTLWIAGSRDVLGDFVPAPGEQVEDERVLSLARDAADHAIKASGGGSLVWMNFSGWSDGGLTEDDPQGLLFNCLVECEKVNS